METLVVQEPSPQSSSSTFKKVFSRSGRSQTESVDQDSLSSSRSRGRLSVESTPDKSRSKSTTELSPEENVRGISKLLTSRRKKKRGAGNSASSQLSVEDREVDELPSPSSIPGSLSLTTDDSDLEEPHPSIPRSSQAGHIATPSPLITTITTTTETQGDDVDSSLSQSHRSSPEDPFPSVSRPDSPSINGSSKNGDSSPRKLEEAFAPSPNQKSPSSSPERRPSMQSRRRSFLADVRRKTSLSEKRAAKHGETPRPPIPNIRVQSVSADPEVDMTLLGRSATSPPTTSIPLLTTVTPPTPTDSQHILSYTAEVTESPESIRPLDSIEKKVPVALPPGAVVSPSGNMISHRRIQSASAASRPPSKLSQTTTLSPTIEEGRSPVGSRTSSIAQTGFFSSMFTAAQNAAQNAASTITSTLSAPPKNKTVTQLLENEIESAESVNLNGEPPSTHSPQSGLSQTELAISTLGSGNLDFSHLDIDGTASGVVTTKDGIVITKPDTTRDSRKLSTIAQRDEIAAKIEDKRAARAVSMAYERSADGPSTPSLLDDAIDSPAAAPLTKDLTPEQTTPSGSVVEGEPGGPIRRAGSVRSRLAKRRHRGSSGATGSTIGGITGNTIAFGLPGAGSSVPRLTGFAVASKKRNRDFHQLFRSVPDDDFLIEDYSCALQREILLAGRIYISEGHICFLSNILGWVTTLVISFDEIVAVEKENTAMVFPNAIAIQTLHARHTFRSLLSREATYDLMVNIWKTSHPSLKSTVNGTRLVNGTGDKMEKGEESISESNESDDDDDVYDEDEDGDGVGSHLDVDGSVIGSEPSDTSKSLTRQTTAPASGGPSAVGSSSALASMLETASGDKNAGGNTGTDFPGPITHPPTEFTDPAGRYDKVIKDEVLPAPLGKVYNLVFGPASGAFMSKFLVEEEKSQDLHFDDDKKGLTPENKTRQYSYIKPLGGSIGPKQTKCISTESLDLLDLEKAVLVTLTTQTPDVPSGNVFSVKTKYLFTWAAGNRTRFFMSCAIEWTGKSWLKGPIEKGAVDGQNTYGNNLVKVLKTAVAPRGRVGTSGKSGKPGKLRRKKGDLSAAGASGAAAITPASESTRNDAQSWGILEPLHRPLGPIARLIRPFWSAHVAITVIGFLLFSLYFRSPNSSAGLSSSGYLGISSSQRLTVYEELWQHEENELWRWLEDRIGLDGVKFPVVDRSPEGLARQRLHQQKHQDRDLDSKLNNERMTERELDQALKITRERLEVLEQSISKRKSRQITMDD